VVKGRGTRTATSEYSGTINQTERSITFQSAPGDEKGQVEILHRTPSSLDLKVTTPSDGLLVLSEVYYPGWQATVNGQATAVLRVDYILRGVPIPAGEHDVEFNYRPATFRGGAVISGATLFALAVAGFWTWLNRKTPEK
jgi:uncharacterized membrane protein YfhO